jgi:hypothetical protein
VDRRLSQPGTIYGSKDGEHDDPVHPIIRQSKIMKESLLCGQCHGLGPNLEFDNPTQCATLYASYLFAYVPEGGTKTCQQCHMHESKLGHNMQSYRSPVMAQMALDVHVIAQALQWRDGNTMTPMAHVTVELFNKTGHAIPDG